ncbi:hypothetical protein TWF694_010625 [Orbilia ellipsospora]|uniref:Carboxymuconolactone decarboxylase-like domain-containing protein n=1 Tax=Orbilia ellipsospora TaxID=2528407 RepID=A0AAV9XBK7_9PEZI
MTSEGVMNLRNLVERYPPITPEALNPTQKEVHEYLAHEIGQYFQGAFTIQDSKTEALVGPFTHFLYLPRPVASGYFVNGSSLAGIPDFPLKCREIAILAIGEHFAAAYELYSHARVATKIGVSEVQIEDVLDGRPPSKGTEQELVSWETARALVKNKGPLSRELWIRIEKAFGKAGAGALIHYAGFYAYTCVLLNGAAVPVPEGESVWPIHEKAKFSEDRKVGREGVKKRRREEVQKEENAKEHQKNHREATELYKEDINLRLRKRKKETDTN